MDDNHLWAIGLGFLLKGSLGLIALAFGSMGYRLFMNDKLAGGASFEAAGDATGRGAGKVKIGKGGPGLLFALFGMAMFATVTLKDAGYRTEEITEQFAVPQGNEADAASGASVLATLKPAAAAQDAGDAESTEATEPAPTVSSREAIAGRRREKSPSSRGAATRRPRPTATPANSATVPTPPSGRPQQVQDCPRLEKRVRLEDIWVDNYCRDRECSARKVM